MNDYEALGRFYDRLMGDEVDNSARADYLLSLFRKHGGDTPNTLLDLACGTGGLCRELACRGVDMVGVDLSEEMLFAAALQVKDCTPSVLLLRQDMRRLDLNDTVEGAVCTQDGMSHLFKTEDIRAVLQRLRLFIAPGGRFIFDVNTPYKHREVLGNRDFVLETDGVVCMWKNLYSKSTGVVTMQLDFFEEQEDGSYERTSDEVRERAYSRRTWQKLLSECGFSLEAIYADRTTEAPTAECERWVIVARNQRAVSEYVE